MTCSCPSGDGSLRWPCSEHPATPSPERRLLDTLGFVDQTIYANDDSRDDLTWTNSEVLELLGLVRVTLLQGIEDQLSQGQPS